jgi:RNA polymerase sigma-70 factor (ECF subfamily)
MLPGQLLYKRFCPIQSYSPNWLPNRAVNKIVTRDIIVSHLRHSLPVGQIDRWSFAMVFRKGHMSKSIWHEPDPTNNLLDEARQGDQEAIEKLLSRYRDSLKRMIDLRLDKRVSQRVDVSDVVQDVLIEAHRRLKVYLDNPVMPFHLWIRQIAQDRLIDAHRRHRASAKRSVDRERRLEAAGPPDASTIELAGQLMDPELTPAARATQREVAERVQECIARLEQRDQDILLMRHYEQLSNQEVATVLGLTEPAASMRYLRALKRLRAVIQSDPSDSLGYPQE